MGNSLPLMAESRRNRFTARAELATLKPPWALAGDKIYVIRKCRLIL